MGFDVLVIEDDQSTRDWIFLTLRNAGLTVRATEHGLHAMEVLREMRPLVVLSDLMMPVMNGWQAVASIRATPGLKSLPIVTMSANPNAAWPEGSNAFLPKPVSKETLLAALRPFLGSLLRDGTLI